MAPLFVSLQYGTWLGVTLLSPTLVRWLLDFRIRFVEPSSSVPQLGVTTTVVLVRVSAFAALCRETTEIVS